MPSYVEGVFDDPEIRDDFVQLVAEKGTEEAAIGRGKDKLCSRKTVWNAKKKYPEWERDIIKARNQYKRNKVLKSLSMADEHEEALYRQSWEIEVDKETGKKTKKTKLKAGEIASLKSAAVRTGPGENKDGPSEQTEQQDTGDDFSNLSPAKLDRILAILNEPDEAES